ncbi:MAG: permease [Lentisphaerae bacterium]|nr:permease [Lentisphaerota bacterium]
MSYFLLFVGAVWGTVTEMAPYLLFGFFVAGVLSVLVPTETVERHLGGEGLWPVIKASLLGVPLPLCSCGVIPVAVSLRRHGASPGATTAFLLSTPQTGVDSIMITYSLMGPLFAVVRPVAAFLSGIVAGCLVQRWGGSEAAASMGTASASTPKRSWGARCGEALHYGFVSLPRDIRNSLIVGLLLAGVISAVVPADFFNALAGHRLAAMLMVMLVGIPLYVCATGSVPIAAAFVAKGLSPGTALVFLMTGPATNAATIAAIWSTMGRRTVALYLGAIVVCSLAAGLILDSLVSAAGASVGHVHHEMLSEPVKFGSALALLAMLAATFIPKKAVSGQAQANAPALTLTVEGMTCAHCVERVEQALAACAGVQKVDVTLKTKQARLWGQGLDAAALIAVVENLGYKGKQNHGDD